MKRVLKGFSKTGCRVFLFILLWTVVLPRVVAAEGNAGKLLSSVIAGVEAHYRSLKDFQADFVQVARILSYPEDQRSEGRVYLKRKRKMRWDYSSPSKDQYFIDGDEVIQYSPEIRQARKVKLSGKGGVRSPLVFFEGLKSAEKDYSISFNKDPAFDRSTRDILQLTPRDSKAVGLARILLFVDKKDFHVGRIDQYDLYGNVTELYFRNVKINQGLADSFFRFKVPDGVMVIEQP
ncbi:MAG: outer membrane lipoprotein carrier protein LolA [Deltaproteobacteria bacterium]|nr:outer membrane lipoprotein carrier protein LolA [Deltaproteobacteria bacterium]